MTSTSGPNGLLKIAWRRIEVVARDEYLGRRCAGEADADQRRDRLSCPGVILPDANHALPAAVYESSSGEELHPSALREPDVKLSPHPAPTLQPRKALPQTPAPPLSGWPTSSAGESGPFAPPALPGFIATADPSVPVPRIGTRRLAGLPLGDLPWHRGNRFPRSAQEPLAGLTPSSCRSPLGQSAGSLRASSQANNWSPVSATFQRFRHVINGSLAFVLPAHT